MKSFESIPYNKQFFIDNYFINDQIMRIYLEKTFHKDNSKDHYFLKLYSLGTSGNLNCVGYIYFYIDFDLLRSDFIGILIKPEYRNNGLASLLVSNWIKLCLDSGIYNLQTNKTQRKPALLYLLKNYTFEIEDPTIYETSNNTINICEGIYDKLKYLYFKNLRHKEDFIKSTIMHEGNYCVLDALNSNYTVLDSVLQSTPYYIKSDNEAYTRSLKNIGSKK